MRRFFAMLALSLSLSMVNAHDMREFSDTTGRQIEELSTENIKEAVMEIGGVEKSPMRYLYPFLVIGVWGLAGLMIKSRLKKLRY